MRFAGTVTIKVPRKIVWAHLMDQAFFVKIAPGINAIKTVEVDKRFIISVGLPIGAQPLAVKGEIVWNDCVEAEKLLFTCIVPFAATAVEILGEMLFSGDENCVITFSAELRNLPSTLPPKMIHGIASQHIRTFFTNLKTETEALHRQTAAS